MNPGVLKLISTGLTLAGAAIGVVAGAVDKKLMSAEIAKQIAEALKK